MRRTSLFFVVMLMGAGCAKERARSVAPKLPATAAPVIEPVITPAEPEPGRIVQVNPAHRFVVVDFGRKMPPPVGRRLMACRHQQLVAVLRLTESGRGRFAVADIVEGDPRAGDEVLVWRGEESR